MNRLQRVSAHLTSSKVAAEQKDTTNSSGSSSDNNAAVYILSAVRTPMGSFGGSLSKLKATELGSVAIAEALRRAGVSGKDVDEVFMGNVLSAGLGQAPARQAALGAGISDTCPCTTVNKVCSSGMKSISLAAQSILLGNADVVVAGGMESMSQAPYLCPKARFGARMGHAKMIDSMMWDGLTDAYSKKAMGIAGEACAAGMKIPREQQDQHAKESYRRAAQANEKGSFDNEIVEVKVKGRRGKVTVVKKDEECFRVVKDFSSLRPAFDRKNGTITAANASTISDGSAAVVLVSSRYIRAHPQLKAKALCRVVSSADAAQAPLWFTTAPAKAIVKALDRACVRLEDVGVFEINEAFSVVALANEKILGLDPKKVNVNGGAVALGHPLGCSGARIVVTLIHAMAARNQRYGVAGICNGGGGASALVLENVSQ
uniref:acetyl-CoA C-acetyltransferase n=1 Tax=Lotharella oceanica TaxID=641309 RepID=A0A7S2U598_9EUKA|mmetsp:Transcript_9440/g.18355  ORF Transcript_9440/g.18355 Transcript_9440/m.18355 type:complete len:431 (+) Transcript_9440:146-1438(+)|eukprot:CAMPEP_0170171436 /NCGR_PEP_ID=MMETSP0040_2-20121228/4578_1 /TAXON_ID=641309 /ORGANISM="Lotharella oceanica, Strain CCMP622" /LENGTH=430 /DNA_ID=CAMNT_0010411487 /DNA_START=75 /DNA_END=1367 /DNA_ORIENTATION=-